MTQFQTFLISILRLAVWLALLAVIFVPLERFFALHSHKLLRKGIGVDLCYYFLSSLLPALILSAPVALLAWSVRQILPGSVFAFTASLPLWLRAGLAFVVGEIGFYWGHRWSHEIPLLWRFHSIHHSAEDLDFLVNTRAHPVDMVFGRFCGIVPMYVLGLAGPTSAAGGSGLPVLVTVVGTISSPKFHHWHHTKTGAIDHNYASTLPWLDRLFGTHHLPKAWPESYGIEAEVPATLLGQLAYPMLPPAGKASERAGEESAPLLMPSAGVTAEPVAEPTRVRE
jgi:sterol desaturase/sphingolipid hydroxylase (fatty acid hydroxylase superfamily)